MTNQQPRYIYGKDSNGVDDHWVIQDRKTRRDLCYSIFWDSEPEWEKRTEADILLIVKALNAYGPAIDRRRKLVRDGMSNRSLASNDRRAMRVEHVLTWCKDWNSSREGLIDLLTDARHWCDRHGESFAELNRIACEHYFAELRDKE